MIVKCAIEVRPSDKKISYYGWRLRSMNYYKVQEC